MRKVPVKEASFSGSWVGIIKITDATGIRVMININKQMDGRLSATLDCLDQGTMSIRVDLISLIKKKLRFVIEKIGVEFVGQIDKVGKQCSGEWRQHGLVVPLKLIAVDHPEIYFSRPQTPSPPFPYHQEQINFESNEHGVTLAGTLTLPDTKVPFPTVLLISGSGAHDRDCTAFGHKPFLILADYLTRNGIATLRFDDRGVGDSTGNRSNFTSLDLANDVLGGVRFLLNQKNFEVNRIGLLGHSEGATVAALTTGNCNNISFLILMAAPGLPGEKILEMQRLLIHQGIGTRPELIEWEENLLRRLTEVLYNESNNLIAEAAMEKIIQMEIEAIPQDSFNGMAGVCPILLAEASLMRTSWFRHFLIFDPRQALSKVQCPVLVMSGSLDIQVPSTPNLMEVERALLSAGNTNVTAVELPGLNHLFQQSLSGMPLEYGEIEETIAISALNFIKDWIFKVAQ